MSLRTVAALGGACLAASCSLLVGTGELANGPLPASDDAAGTANADADASSTDGDATPPDPPADPCVAPMVVLCERFDTEEALRAYPPTTDPSTTVSSDTTAFFSGPRSARFQITPSSNTSPDATITLQTSAALTRFAVEGWVYIDHGEPQQNARLLLVKLGTSSLTLDPSGVVREVGGGVLASFARIALGKWVRVVVEVRADTTPKTASLSIGDVTAPAMPLVTTWPAGPVIVRLGVSEANSPTEGWLVRWDDIVVRQL